MRDAALITLILRDLPAASKGHLDPDRLAELFTGPCRVWVNDEDGTRTFLFEVEPADPALDPPVCGESVGPSWSDRFAGAWDGRA